MLHNLLNTADVTDAKGLHHPKSSAIDDLQDQWLIADL